MPERPVIFLSTHPSGGIRELWANLAEAFQAGGTPVGLVGLYPAPHMPNAADPIPWEHMAHAKPGGPLGQIKMLAALAGWLRRTRPHAVVTAMPMANVVVPLIARVFSPGTRVVVSHHSPTETHSRALDKVDGLSGQLRNVAAVVSVSDTVARSLDTKPSKYRAKRRTIHNGLPPEIEQLLGSLAPAEPRSGPRGRRLVATGRLAYQKNYPLLLRAVAEMRDVALDVIGTGPDEAELTALVEELGIGGRVVFHGHQPREQALRLLAAGDVFVQVSRFEGHSLGLLEAAKLSLPLVVSAIPVQIEAVTARDGSLCAQTVEQEDVAGLAAACERLLDDPVEYRRWSSRAATIAEEFTFAAMLDKYRRVLF